MGEIQLISSAEKVVQSLYLPDTEQQKMRETVARYSKPEGFGETLKWLVFRTVQAIKSLFYQSNWQQAERAIKNNIAQLVAHDSSIGEEYKRIYSHWTEEFTKFHLDLCLHMQQNKIADSEEFNNFDVKQYLEKVAPIVKEKPLPKDQFWQQYPGLYWSGFEVPIRIEIQKRMSDPFTNGKTS